MKTHWEHIYEKKGPTQVSWYQEHAQSSLQYIRNTGIQKTDHIIDVGGGASTLVDDLIADGFQRISVLDVSGTALRLAQQRLGARATYVNWMEADILEANLPEQAYDVWHDRAVFHFLREPGERAQYLRVLGTALAPGGHVVLATFGPEGPPRCSGLEVQRYSAAELSELLGSSFELVRQDLEDHVTPRGGRQQFLYGLWKRRDAL